jgi:hypothetical protein
MSPLFFSNDNEAAVTEIWLETSEVETHRGQLGANSGRVDVGKKFQLITSQKFAGGLAELRFVQPFLVYSTDGTAKTPARHKKGLDKSKLRQSTSELLGCDELELLSDIHPAGISAQLSTAAAVLVSRRCFSGPICTILRFPI